VLWLEAMVDALVLEGWAAEALWLESAGAAGP